VTAAVAFDAMGTLFDVAPVEQRYGEDAMPRLVHAAGAVTLAESWVEFPRLVAGLLGPDAVELFSRLEAYPDAAEALATLAGAGIRAIVLTNGSAANTRTLLDRAGLDVEQIVTTAEAGAYKPHPAPYRLACERLELPSERVTLDAAHAWDCFGARKAGLGAVWIPRGAERWPFPPPEPPTAGGLADAARLVAG
jgi:2-haloacid dehalogenase